MSEFEQERKDLELLRKAKKDQLIDRELWISHIKWLLQELDRCESTSRNIKGNLVVYAKLLGLKIDIEKRTVS